MAAAKAALKAALKLAHEAQTAAKEAEVLAAARQYHAAHVSSESNNNSTGDRSTNIYLTN